jgi:hypothetical protein
VVAGLGVDKTLAALLLLVYLSISVQLFRLG